jgi:AcrR family transcriptional regulator
VAASEAFAAHGPNVSVDEIAKRAGVGHGTVFRRFPSKEALLAAVVTARVQELSELAESLLEKPDAGAAFDGFVWQVAESQVTDRALFECGPLCAEMPEVAESKARLHEAVSQLVGRAQKQGSVRRDLEPNDVPLLIGSALMSGAQSGDPTAWRRYIRVVLDGLRAQTVADSERSEPRRTPSIEPADSPDRNVRRPPPLP